MIASWLPHSGRADLPSITSSLHFNCLQIQLGQEALQALHVLHCALHDYFNKATHSHSATPGTSSVMSSVTSSVESCVKRNVMSSVTSNVTSSVTSNARSSEWCASESSVSVDDLRSGLLVYVSEASAVKVKPGEIGFHTDPHCATMTWHYTESRLVTKLSTVCPVPFYFQHEATSNSQLKLHCVLQYSLTCDSHFEDYAEFSLSETDACSVELPRLSDGGSESKPVSCQLWRIIMFYPDSVIGADSVRGVGSAAVVSPQVLAACLQVDSMYVRALVPAVRLAVRVACVRVRLFNNTRQTCSLPPFTLSSPSLANIELLLLQLNDTRLLASQDKLTQLLVSVDTRCACNVLQLRDLTMWPLLKDCKISSSLDFNFDERETKVAVECRLGTLRLSLGQSVIWTLNYMAQTWASPLSRLTETSVIACYVICNDTQETVQLGQADTDEYIVLATAERQCSTAGAQTDNDPCCASVHSTSSCLSVRLSAWTGSRCCLCH